MALNAFVSDKNIALFEKYKVFSKVEVESRYEVFSEEYKTKVKIEGELALNIARTMILPVACRQQKEMAATVKDMVDLGITNGISEQKAIIEKIGSLISEIILIGEKLEKACASDTSEAIIEYMNSMRDVVDTLEVIVDDELWPLPKYSEMLFIY
jgi:glutamine synthetase